jgi:hypothetical protein
MFLNAINTQIKNAMCIKMSKKANTIKAQLSKSFPNGLSQKRPKNVKNFPQKNKILLKNVYNYTY